MYYTYVAAILISSISFLVYAVSYFVSPHMKNEFERFGLAKWGLLTIILEIMGALGLLVGLVYKPILLIACGGLSLLMLFGLLARIKSKDSLRISLPAIFYMVLNGYIFYLTVNL
jgi:hypothetical protein